MHTTIKPLDLEQVMHCMCRCACTLHRKHLTACHVQGFFFSPNAILELELSARSLHHMLRAACLSNAHINHSTKDEVTATPRTGHRGCTVSPSLCPHLGEKKLRAACGSVRLTGQMLLLEAGHSWLDPSCYASILPQAAMTATFPTH